jgi:peptide/nickel transport system substrate-binding protein
MRRGWLRWTLVPVLAALLALAAACGGDDDSADTSGGDDGGGDAASQLEALAGPAEFGEVAKGGTFRISLVDFGFTAAFDPSAEYLGSGWNTLTTMVRPLLGYRFTAGETGNELLPDAATALPEVSADGLTYTFQIKDGIQFGPPLNREVTSEDYVYAFERLGTASVGAGYANYYQPIRGFQAFADGDAQTISGIATPDDKTIVFTLTEPRGDFPYALAMPASAPIPREVGECFEQSGQYGRYVISTGPYMFEGSENLNAQSCDTMQPISGYNPTRFMNLVRNPSYDPATDSPEMREANPDRIEFTINTNQDDIFDRITRGQLEGSYDAATSNVIREYTSDPELRDRLRVNGGDRTWYLTMDMTQAPFDDIHVRKAMNLVMDLEGMQRAWGGPVSGEVATTITPDGVLYGQLTNEDYQPYQKPPFAGDVEAAKAEMAQSKYDTNQDGTCDAGPCKGILTINRNYAAWAAMTPLITQNAAEIGIEINVRELPTSPAYTTTQNPSRGIVLAANHGWGKDYADPATFAVLWYGPNIIPSNNSNTALVGITPAIARSAGIDRQIPANVPNIDADIDACAATTGEEREQCYVDLERKVMEEVVPFVPYLDSNNVDAIGPAVTKYDYDQFTTEISLNHVAVDPSLQQN